MSTPVISSISPNSGSIEGGTTVIIKGTNLSAVTAVTIGGIAATDLNVSSTQISCTTPAGVAGTDDVVAINGNYGTVWTQTNAPTSTNSVKVAISSDGQIQTAVYESTGIYYSADAGQSWSASTAGSLNWYSVAISSDDQTKQTAVVYGGGIYYSTDTGNTWSQSNAPSLYWFLVAMSSDGKYQTAVVYGGGIYYSTDTGHTWTASTALSLVWYSVAMSSSGQHQTAVYGGGIYYSADTGHTWTASTALSLVWYSVAMSSSGQYQTAVVFATDGGVWTSDSFGANWSQSNAPQNKWNTVAMSSDGTIQTAGAGGGGDGSIWISHDSGVTWTQSDAPYSNWYSCAMSSDGTIQIISNNFVTDAGIWTSVATDTFSNSLTYTYKKIVISNICFPAGTPITTDQGNIPIDKINPDIHTIHNNKIVAITKTITQDTHLVCFEKHSLGLNKPNKKTVTSKNHKVYYNGKMTEAQHFVGKFKKVSEIEYNGEILYNVLMKKHDKLKANNLTFETLDPENIIAKLYTSNFDEEYKDNIIVMINNSIMQNDHRLYQTIINRVVNDKSLSTCFDEEPEYEYEEPEYEEPVNTTRIDTIRNSAEKTYHSQSVNVKNKINLDNNVNLHSKLNKYAKIYQNKDDMDEIIKKKEFITLQKEEKERQKLIKTKNKTVQHVVEKAKTYKRVQIFKKNGTSKRLF